jgi:hypothetical protein
MTTPAIVDFPAKEVLYVNAADVPGEVPRH